MGPDVTALKFNAGQTGFYRVHYASEEMLSALGDRVLDKSLPATDRWGLQQDLFAMVRGGRVSTSQYLDFLKAYDEEDDFLPAVGMAENLHLLYFIAEGALRDRVAKAGKRLMDGVLQRIGFDPKEGEANTTRMLRDAIYFRAMIFGSDAARSWGVEKFEKILGGGSVHPDIQRSALQIGAWLRPDDALDWFVNHLRASESEHERMNILTAMGCLSDEAVMRKALAHTLEHVPQRNRHLPMVSCTSNPMAQGYLWDWFMDNIEQLETLHPLLLERVIDTLVPVCGLGREESVKAFLSDYLSRKKSSEATVRIALEFLAVNERTRRQ
jgi:tricorn protease interacting factor F2/3